jgi:PilZ domain
MTRERRSSPRKLSNLPIEVADTMTGETIGRIGNLSRTGMMLICHRRLRNDALYQLRFSLTDTRGRRAEVETGVHTMWTEPAGIPGQQWSGLRIISISAPAAETLDAWLTTAEALGD